MLRLFVAVPIREPGVLDFLAAVANEAGRARVRWTEKHQLHFTLRFFVSVEESRVASMKEAVSQAVGGAPRFVLELVGLGAFPRAVAPRVIWAGTGEGKEALVSLEARLTEQLLAAEFPPDDRRFSPHLTLGRVREGGGTRSLQEFLKENATRAFGKTEVGEVVLYQSVLGSGPPAHTPLLTCRLV